MKLFIKNRQNNKTYISHIAKSRTELLNKIGNEFFTVAGEVYTVWDVQAEPETSSTGAGTVIGGIVGLLGGPIGLVIGGAVGAALGNNQDFTEKEKVKYFNHS